MLPLIVVDQINSSQEDWLYSKWLATAKNIGIKSNQAKEFFELICKQYKQKHRAYHNLSHLYSLFQVAEKYKGLIQNHSLLELSIWFHDIIYSIRRKDNEAKSADLAIELLKPYLKTSELRELRQMITATSNHKSTSPSSDSQILLDFDLSILAAERKVYIKYKKAVRKEFKRYPSFLFKIGRRKVLLHFLEMESIFQSKEFYTAYEDIARENLQWELKNL